MATTKTEALQSMFSQFGVSAYPSGQVPEPAAFPYLTYTKGVGSPYESTLHYYDYTESEKDPDDVMETICETFRHGGIQWSYDTGFIWAYISDNTDWYAATDEVDRLRKHRLCNITLDFEGE